MRLLLGAAPGAAMLANNRNMLAVHTAAALGTPAVLQLLLDAVPGSITAAGGEDGMQPIHCAAANDNTATVELLLAALPQLAMAADANGWTAAHHAASADDNGVPALQLLLAATPEASCALVRDAYGWIPAHLAARDNCPAALRCLFESAPVAQQALATTNEGSTPLVLAADHRSVAAAEVLLEAAPEACMVRNNYGIVPLALAAHRGQESMVALLLAAAPQAALLPIVERQALPIHIAAEQGHAAVVAQLLVAQPEAAAAVMEGGLAPLDAALQHCHDPDKRAAVAHVLLPVGPPVATLNSLLQAGLAGRRLLPDFIAARLPLSDTIWSLLPRPCSGLVGLLPAALQHGTQQAHQLVQHLPAPDVARLRCAALCLARAQRRARVSLPAEVAALILAHLGP